jgi:hypothetical protein
MPDNLNLKMNKNDLKALTEAILDLYVTIKLRPQDEVTSFDLKNLFSWTDSLMPI